MNRYGHWAGMSRCGHAGREGADMVWIIMALSCQFRCFRWRWRGCLRATQSSVTVIPMLCFKRPVIRPTSTLFTYDPEKPWCQGRQQQALFKCRRSLSYPPHRRTITADWALSGSLQTLGSYRAVLMRYRLRGQGLKPNLCIKVQLVLFLEVFWSVFMGLL